MQSKRLKIALVILLVLVVLVIATILRLRGPLSSLAGYAAKVTCSGVFLSGRDPADIRGQELNIKTPVSPFIRNDVDRARQEAHGFLPGIITRTAVYRPGLGCTLDSDVTVDELRHRPVPAPEPVAAVPWPDGGADGIDRVALDRAISTAFEEPDPTHLKRTRAVVAIHDGKLAAERYAPGYGPETRLQGWSMAKSITNALVGILVGQGKLNVKERASVAEWANPTDPRHAITLDQLLRMSSGLEFKEAYDGLESDVIIMLFRKFSAGAYAATKPLIHPPGTHWEYASGTTNIISRIVREAVGGNLSDYWLFPRKSLFDPIGMSGAVIEPDPSGTFVGSSFSYATARDWARLGQLYLDDGIANGKRILPEGWVKYSVTPTPKAPQGSYGAQIWLNTGEPSDPANRPWPKAPRDAFAFQGFEGQHVFVVPSRRLVVVRLGFSQAEGGAPYGPSWNPGDFLAAVTAVFPETKATPN